MRPSRNEILNRILAFVLALGGVFFSCQTAYCASSRAPADLGQSLSSITDGDDASLAADDRDDVHAAEKLGRAIHQLVYAENFDRLEEVASSIRASKARYSGGGWKINAFYRGTSQPDGHATDEDWRNWQNILERWIAAKPQSITARVALAYFYIDYAWNARGDGTVDSVTSSGWRLFSGRLQKARDVLEASAKLSPMCPEWYLAMQQVALGQGWQKQEAKALLTRAIAFEPEYFYYYRSYAIFVLPKWNGVAGESESFVRESANRIGGARGDALYFQLASYLMCRPEGSPQLRTMLFSRIYRGFLASEKLYGVSLTNMNMMAVVATKMSEATIADELIRRIGDATSLEAWREESYFQSSKSWTNLIGPAQRSYTESKAAAEANMVTAEGMRYDAEFCQRYASAITACFQNSDPALGGSDLYLKIDEKGVMGGMMAFGHNPDAACLYKLTNKTLTPPSHAPFWIRLTFEPIHPVPTD